ncbi:MAG: hypothetical protein A3J93_03640 [Candidatus Magasanikbacteria bacterium RIFOXYC2_FULL_42_28]|uniref:DUF4015 domain-containing protein n=1 Tax=Candidatus Magasanikbacteria bacterium RIFOXYC2_FULL_42_28 TaxID=1798704 RepID=A0A1F6NUU8_9BACT|nr:MAG: hypothetical protein A3J93_03640 [Candidatus Magasanikbacteria bacterium RIFOXYC2_FULL_42_28]
MLNQHKAYYWLIVLTAYAAGAFLILNAWEGVNLSWEASTPNYPIHNLHLSYGNSKPPARVVKGLYLTAYSAGNPAKIDEIINLIDKTELNAVVIDIKDYSGLIFYPSQVPLVVKINASENRLRDIVATIKKLHDHNIYVIARQTVFQDPFLAEARPEWAIKSKSGGSVSATATPDKLWRDNKGLTWVDPTRKEVWNYNLAIAREAAELGFDEINFDYVRFPSDGPMSQVVYSDTRKLYEIMGEFYKFIGAGMKGAPVWISLDMFGFVMEKSGEDDMRIGQRVVDAVNFTDYISPMMYPSHYPSGHLNLKNPAAFPGAVIDNGMKMGEHFFTTSTRAQVRPWLQAFNMGAIYDAEKIRAQIDMVEKYPNAGWLLWNASNRYSDAGLTVCHPDAPERSDKYSWGENRGLCP